MNDGNNRWWIAALVTVILVLVLLLAATQTEHAQGAAGLLGLILLGVCLIALLLVLAAVWPGFAARAERNLQGSPGKTFLVGLVNYVFLGAIALVLMNLGPIAAIGVVLGGFLLLGTFLGLPAVVALVGARLHSLREGEATRWEEVVTGGIALYLAVFVPVVGWFILLPAICLWSFGVAALTLMSRQQTEPVALP